MINKKKNFTEGPLFFRIILFAIPIMLTSALQIVYNMADNIVVGKFSGDELALAAVGCTASLVHLITNLLIGISAGSGVVIAQLYGKGDEDSVSRATHTAISFSAVGGVAVCLIGLVISRPALILMGTNDAIIDNATLYFRIICLGIPASSVYNFGASVLRSTGDSKTPLAVLATSGLVNVGLNLVFVIVFRMSVAGVAIATITAQYLSAIGVMLSLIYKKKGQCYAFSFKKIGIEGRLLKRIIRLGLPAGVQSCMFSLSNILITSAINTFPPIIVSANTISSQVDAITYAVVGSVSQAAMTVVGQNYGAKKPERIRRALAFSMIHATVFGVAVSRLEILFKTELATLFVDTASPNAAVIVETATQTIELLLSTYILCGIMDIFSSFLKGMGYSLLPMLLSIGGICGVRIFWLYAIFPLPAFSSYRGIMISYPVSWAIALAAFSIAAAVALVKLRKKMPSTEIKNRKAVSPY